MARPRVVGVSAARRGRHCGVAFFAGRSRGSSGAQPRPGDRVDGFAATRPCLRSAHSCRRRHERGRRDRRAADLRVAIRKENTSAAWHREEQVVGENPDLIVSPPVVSPGCTCRRGPAGCIGALVRSGREQAPRFSCVCGGAQSANAIHRVFTFSLPDAWWGRTVGRNSGCTSAGAEKPLERLHRARRSGEGFVS